jgi:hypothetical protein
MPFNDFGAKTCVSSTGALLLEKIPETMTIVGGGVIGLELGSVWARLGTKVTVVEFLDKICATMDGELVAAFQRSLKKWDAESEIPRPCLGFKGLGFSWRDARAAGDLACKKMTQAHGSIVASYSTCHLFWQFREWSREADSHYPFRRNLKFNFKLSTKVVGAEITDTNCTLTVEPAAGGAQEKITSDVTLVAVGRRPRTEDLGLEAIGVKVPSRLPQKQSHHAYSPLLFSRPPFSWAQWVLDRNLTVLAHEIETLPCLRITLQLDKAKRIVTPALGDFSTGVPGVYAIGDCIAGPMLAHKAEEEGVSCVESLAGKHGHVNYNVIPGVIYTHPEVNCCSRVLAWSTSLKHESLPDARKTIRWFTGTNHNTMPDDTNLHLFANHGISSWHSW